MDVGGAVPGFGNGRPAFAAAARSLGVSTGQLNTALGQAKQSLAEHS